MDFCSRQKKLREHLATTRFDALLISHLPNIRYLCGFTGSAGLLLVKEAGSVFFTDVRYDTQAHEEVKSAKVVIPRKSLLAGFGEWLGKRRKRAREWTIGIEAEHFTVAEKKRLAQALPSGIRVKDAPSVVERARMVKDADELNRIRAAVALGARLFDRAVEVMRPGVKETEVAAEMEYAARRAGAQEMSFPDDHCVGSTIGAAAWPRIGPAHRSRRIRGLRLRCYTRRLLFGPDAYCMGRVRIERGPPGVRGGARKAAGGNRCGAAWRVRWRGRCSRS